MEFFIAIGLYAFCVFAEWWDKHHGQYPRRWS